MAAAIETGSSHSLIKTKHTPKAASIKPFLMVSLSTACYYLFTHVLSSSNLY
jgi:hypothetical protein